MLWIQWFYQGKDWIRWPISISATLREDADLTQGQIAGMIPCSQQAYSLYERGDRDIPTGVLIRLAEIHRTTVDYLLGLTDCREIPACMARK